MSTKHLDTELRMVWRILVQDLREVVSNTETPFKTPFDSLINALSSGNMNHVRRCSFPNYMIMPSEYARAARQAELFGKRWLFDDDANDEEVTCPGWAREVADAKTVIDFMNTQRQVLSSLPSTQIVNRVLQGAEALCGYILGDYDEEEHKRKCRFGSRASYGLPRSKAYMFNRLKDLSATRSQVAKWGRWLTEDVQLAAILRTEIVRARSLGLEQCINLTEHLNLTIVPKKYNIGRVIVPDTILGGFISNGLGHMIMDRLKVNAGLDIRTKQREHREVARRASVTGHLVTADMSKASDNISWALLQRILPPDWLEVIKHDKVTAVKYENDLLEVASPLLMGKGYTFPLQTLVFYSLLVSIADQLGIGHKYISVYGDDLIYPQKMHKYVLAVFPQLGLKINVDKTSADKGHGTAFRKSGCFRESCGGDYLDGKSIRPYAPMGRSGDPDKNITRFTTQSEKAAMYYTLLNGLLSRWEWWEIRTTVRYLLIAAQNCTGELLIVPNTRSVSSGLRYDADGLQWLLDVEENLNVEWPKRTVIRHKDALGGYSDVWSYWSLDEKPPKVKVEDEYIYLWDKLRQKAENLEDDAAIKDVLPHISIRMLKWAPEYRNEELKGLCRQKWESEPETLKRTQRKLFVDKFNRLHEDRPKDGPSQVVWMEVSTVDSREEKGMTKKDRRTVPLHLLFDPRLQGINEAD